MLAYTIIFSLFQFCQNVTGLEEALFIVSAGKRLTPAFDAFIVESKIICCANCSQTRWCLSANFNNSSRICELVPLPSLAVQSYASVQENWNAYTTDGWLLVFRGTASNGIDMYDSWINGNNVVSDDVNCMRLDMTSCIHHYRNTIVDSWSAVPITRVKFALFKDGQEKHYIIFDGTGTDRASWFDSSRILTSSWMDLATSSFNYFSLAGAFNSRRFYISTFWGGCPDDTGYLLVISEVPDGTWTTCTFDIQTSYPAIIYAESMTGGVVFESSTGVEKADFIAISITTV